MITTEDIATVERSLDAMRQRRIDDFVGCLHPDVELHTRRGVISGRRAVEAWAMADELDHLEAELGPGTLRLDGEQVIARVSERLRWRGTREVIDESYWIVRMRMRDGLIVQLKLESERSP